jgi:hypothetical protein
MATRINAPTLGELERRAAESCVPGAVIVSPEEWFALFDEAVRAAMDMSAEDFIARWEAGEYDEVADTAGHRHIMELGMLIPTLVRKDP